MTNIKIKTHVVKELPTERPLEKGAVYKVEQPNGDLLTYTIDSSGNPVLERGITNDQNARLERLSSEQISKVESITTGDITKLKQDYTKAEIDQQFNDVRNLANSSRINLNGSTVLPVPPRRPDNTIIEDAWVRLAQNVTYTQAGGSPLTGIDGHETVAEWNNEDGEWVLIDMGELPQVQGVDTINPLGEGLPKEKAVAEYVEERTVPITHGKNMFNPENTKSGQYINNSGNVLSEEGWAWSGLIDISDLQNGEYLFLSSDKDRRGIAFYSDSVDVNAPRGGRFYSANTGVVNKQEGDKYIGFNLYSPTQNTYTWAQLEIGSVATEYEPFKKIVPKSTVEDLENIEINSNEAISKSLDSELKLQNFAFEKIDQKNLLNPNEAEEESLLNYITGGYSALASRLDYTVTPMIPAESGDTFEILNSFGGDFGCRNYCLYDASGNFISGYATGNDRAKSITVPSIPNVAGIKLSIVGQNYPLAPGLYYPIEMGVFKGVGNVFEYYTEASDILIPNNIPTVEKQSNSIATISDVNTIVNNVSSDIKDLDYSIDSAGVLTISKSGLGSITVSTANNRGYEGNDVFNFVGYNIMDISGTNGDDVAPIHAMNTTIGANHGYSHQIATIASHGLINSDIGKSFSKGGVTFILLRIVNINQVAFISANNGTASSPSFTALTTGTISLGSTDYTITAVTSQQLYPSVKNLNIRVLIKGKEIVKGTSGKADSIDIIEEYEIKSIDSIIQNSVARTGSSTAPDFNGDGFIKIKNNYRFGRNLSCQVFLTTRQILPSTFVDIMATQAVVIGGNDGQTQYYVPNSNPLNGSVDLRKPTTITWSSSIPTAYIVNNNQPEPNNPPNRVVQYRENVGFMVGYIKDRGVGASLNDFTARTFAIRGNTGKIYPHAIESSKVGSTPSVNTVFSVGMYRIWTDLSKTRVGGRLSMFEMPLDSNIVIFLDYSASMFDHVVLEDSSLNGRNIEVLESRNCSLVSDLYNEGFYVNATYVEGETCYLIVKI